MTWEQKSLDEIGFIGRGRSRNRPRNAEHLYGGDYPFVQTGDIKASNFRITEFNQTYNEAGLAQSKLWKEGTLCITIAANIADTAILGMDACFPDSIIGFVADENKSDVRFVKYFFDIFQARMKSISTGAAQDNLSLEKLLTFKIPTPPLPAQHKIASILSSYDDLIENNLKRIKVLEEKAFASYKLIVNSEKLDEFTIEELAHVVMGQSPTSDTYNEEKEGLPFHQGNLL
jgi:type I restriction enzyme S subunit